MKSTYIIITGIGDYMQAIVDAIYEEIDGLYKKTEAIQGVWRRAIAEREFNRDYSDKRNIESTNYEMRVEFVGFSFRVRWHEVRFVKNGNKTLRLIKSIAVPESGKYKASQFGKAQEWELLLVTRMEDALSEIRYQLKHLGKAHNAVVWASKRSKQKIKTIEIKHRVEKTNRSIKAIKESLKK